MLRRRRLNRIEAHLLDCLVNGSPLNERLVSCSTVPAEAIRRVLIDRVANGRAGPMGLQLDGVTIDGYLDLRRVRTEIPLQLERCTITGHIDLTDAELRRLSLAGSSVISAAPRSGSDGHDIALRLERAHIKGLLDLTDLRITNKVGSAIVADGLVVDQDAVLCVFDTTIPASKLASKAAAGGVPAALANRNHGIGKIYRAVADEISDRLTEILDEQPQAVAR